MILRRILATAAVAFCAAAGAQDYPTKPIRMVTPWPPGGGTDIVTRLVSQKLSEAWGQQVIVDNRAGATGTIGTEFVVKSPPDGYTLIIGTNATHVIAVGLMPKLPYDQDKDLTPITRIAAVPHVIAVNANVPAKSLGELIALAKANPGRSRSVRPGTAARRIWPARRSSPSPEWTCSTFRTREPASRCRTRWAGRSRFHSTRFPRSCRTSRAASCALAIAGPKRISALPDVPTVAEEAPRARRA